MNKPDRAASKISAQKRWTRRSWAAFVAAAPLAAQVAATPQTTPPVSAPTPSPQAAAKAVDDVRKVSERLAQTEVPMSVEPAFSFRAR